MTGFALGLVCGWVTFAVALAVLLARAPAIERPRSILTPREGADLRAITTPTDPKE